MQKVVCMFVFTDFFYYFSCQSAASWLYNLETYFSLSIVFLIWIFLICIIFLFLVIVVHFRIQQMLWCLSSVLNFLGDGEKGSILFIKWVFK